MTSSGMKRGLATAAISALAVTGVPAIASSAYADTIASTIAPTEVDLYSVTDGGQASFKNDGVDTKVHLVAAGGSDVKQIRFEYNDVVNGWTAIDTVSRANGVFGTYWTPPASTYNLPTDIRAVALGSVGTEIGTPAAATVTVSNNTEAIDIANAPGSAVGVYTNPAGDAFGAVHGTTSDVAADPNISLSSPQGAGTTTEDVVGTPAGGVNTFSGPVNFKGYHWDADATDGTVNEAAVVATDASQDAEAVSLYKATITTVSATIDPSTVQGNGKGTGIVTVLDQSGKPVVGAYVHMEGEAPMTAPTLTNSEGKAEFPNLQDTSTNGTGTTYAFFVDANGNGSYDSGSEFRRTATVTRYTPVVSSLAAASHDGPAFDVDEYNAAVANGEGDLTITVKDQNGAPLNAGVIVGKWTRTAFPGDTTNPDTETEAAAISDLDGDGIYDVALPTTLDDGTWKLDAWIEKDGTPGESAGDLQMAPLTVKAGQASIDWADGDYAQRAAGATSTFTGTMELADGTGLPARDVAISWTPSGNAVIAATQPGATKRTGDQSATSTTGNDGSFAVAIADPSATPNTNETGGVLKADSVDTPNIGDAGATGSEDVDFLANVAPATVSMGDDYNLISGGRTPGRPVTFTVHVANKDGNALADQSVTLKTDHGFFTPTAVSASDLVADPAPAAGGLYGEWKSLGNSTTVKTDDNGDALVTIAIAKDAGFDDDGSVTSLVTATVGSAVQSPVSYGINWSTDNDPLNPGSVDIVLDKNQDSSILPDARNGQSVYYDVFAKDQFGNLVKDNVDVSDDSSDADFNSTGYSQYTGDDAAVTAYNSSGKAADQKVSVQWVEATNVFGPDADAVTPGYQASGLTHTNKTLTDTSDAIHWYVLDMSKAVYSMSHSPAGSSLPVGTAVTETFKAADQKGQGIDDLAVQFLRSGPSTQNGDTNSFGITNNNGEAKYTYAGSVAGTAVVTGVAYNDYTTNWYTGAIMPQGDPVGRASDTVKFADPQVHIRAGLSLSNNKYGNDVAKVLAPASAHGATVKLFRVTADGKRHLVATKKANSAGDAIFTVKDLNGKKYTKYDANVGATARTFAAWTPRKSIR